MNPKEALLTQERLRELFDCNPTNGTLYRRGPRWAGNSGTVRPDGYCVISIDGKRYLTHRLIWFLVHGTWPKYLDHIDGNPSNNRYENLREATISQNAANSQRRSDNRTGFKGVSFNKSRDCYQSFAYFGGKAYWCGYFTTPEEAHAAYLKRAKEFHGKFIRPE